MEIQFLISFEEYYEYNRVYARLALGKRLDMIFSVGLIGLLLAAVGAIAYFTCLSGRTLLIVLAAAVAIVSVYMMLFAKKLFFVKVKRDAKKRYRQDDYFENERIIAFDGRQVSDRSEAGDCFVATYSDDVKEFFESKNLFIITVHGRRGIIIPKRIIEEQSAMRRDLRLVSEKYDVNFRYING